MFKKYFMQLFTILSFIAILFTFIIPTYAIDVAENHKPLNATISSDNGITLENSRTTNAYEFVTTLISTSMDYYSWMGYHPKTPTWTKSIQYQLLSSTSYSISANKSYFGITVYLTATQTNGVNTIIPANSSKFSRLGIYADIRVNKYNVDEYYYGSYLRSYITIAATPIDTYVDVVYQ